MKLASLKKMGSRDGELVVVSPDGKRALRATSIACSLREALERWTECEPALRRLDQALRTNAAADGSFQLDPSHLLSAVPRTFLFADGSAFIHHIKLVRKARNAALPATLETVPLMYQAESARFLSPTEDIPQIDFKHGTDLEAEVGVIVDDVPMGVTPSEALKHIKLLVLINDVSLRGLIPAELEQGFGFFVSKPAKVLSPFALTPEELGSNWRDGRLHLPLRVELNNQFFGRANAGAMHFHFGQLVAHAAQTRDLAAGSIIGSGTVSNEDASVGSSCLVEKRMIEQIETGTATTSFLKPNDRVKIWMEDESGRDLFGVIEQKVTQVSR